MPYQEGKIVAKGFKEGKEAAQYELKTAGKPFRLLLQADREELAADGQDLLHLSIQLIDEKGVLVPNADRTIEVEVSGNGVLKGVDNGDLRREGSYGGNRIKTYSAGRWPPFRQLGIRVN